MKTYYYCVEMNLGHPMLPEVSTDEDLRAVNFISRNFMDTESALRSVEADIIKRLDKFIKTGNIPVRVSETNPLRLATYDQLEEKAKDDEEFANYLGTWDTELVSRMTIIDENLTDADDEVEGVNLTDMPPKDFILRYYIREYEDGMEIPAGAEGLIAISRAIH